MHFLIDYENVNSTGLHGAELLNPADTVTVFYSQQCTTMPGEFADQLRNSKCTAEFIRVKNGKKNALDFQVVTYVAEHFAQDEHCDRMAIVSKDRDFESVRDYWQGRKRQLYCTASIAQGFAYFGPGGEQKKKAARMLQTVAMGEVEEEHRLLSLLGENADQLDAIQPLFNAGGRALYLECMRRMGRVRGTETYRKLKEYLGNGEGKNIPAS